MSRKFHVAILGVTGAVGEALLDKLAERKFPVGEIKLLASPRSAGLSYRYDGSKVPVVATDASSFEGVEFAFFA